MSTLLCTGASTGLHSGFIVLQNRLDDEDMSPECKAEVVRDQNRMAQDYRLNWRLKTACKADIGTLCDGLCNDKEGQMCGGVVLQCLQVGTAGVFVMKLFFCGPLPLLCYCAAV
jgi:hypothetical protein